MPEPTRRAPRIPGLSHARALVEVPKPAGDRSAAVRMGLGVAVPTLLLLALGLPHLTIYAVFGAFTGMYGRADAFRLPQQLRAAVLLVSGVTLGTLAARFGVDSWSLVLLECVYVAFASAFADRSALRPAGPFFGLFALGACASVPLVVSAWVPPLVAAGAAAVGIAIGVARTHRLGREHLRWRAGPPAPISWRRAGAYAVAVGLAGAIATLIGLGHPIWAMAAAAVPLAVTGTGNRVRRGTHRILGTFAGLVVTAALLIPFGTPEPTVLVLLIIVLQFPTELYMSRNYGLALVFFTPLILLMTQLAAPADSVTLIVDRAAQTALGASVGIAVVLTAPLTRRRAR